MLRDLKGSVIAIVVLTAVLGLGLPALFTGFSQLAFSSEANGSLIKVNGNVVDQVVCEAACAAASAAVEPHDDIHASGAYRKTLIGVMVERALRDAMTGPIV